MRQDKIYKRIEIKYSKEIKDELCLFFKYLTFKSVKDAIKQNPNTIVEFTDKESLRIIKQISQNLHIKFKENMPNQLNLLKYI